jgi:hypothetical protein
MVLAATFFLLLLAGLLAGILALALTKRDGFKGVMGRAVTGLTLNALLVVLFVTLFTSGFIKGRQRAQANTRALARMSGNVRDIQQDMARQLLDPNHPPEIGSGSAYLDEIKRSAESAARNADGSLARIMNAAAAYTAKMNEATKTYERAAQKVKDARVLAPGVIQSQADIEGQRQLIRQFADANLTLKTFIQNAADHFRVEMEKQGLPDSAIQSALKGYHKQADVIGPMTVQIRETDERISRAMLGALDLLDDNWGKWRYQPPSSKVLFDETDTRNKYNAFASEIADASELQGQLQVQLGQQVKSFQQSPKSR